MKTYNSNQIANLLYQKYSSSQTYFYINKISQIAKQKRTSVNIWYEDIEFLLDNQENLKRWYANKQFNSKMNTFKQYYFYHEDCPRIFMKGIEDAYTKWQDRKRDLVYKKLKLIYNQSYSSRNDSQMDDQKSKNYVNVSHFLLQISEYNPYSKKYYLRVEEKLQRQKKKSLQQKKNRTRRDLQFLNHQLSEMLNQISFLSNISTLSSNRLAGEEKYENHKINRKKSKKQEQKSSSLSRNNNIKLRNSNSLIKFNFNKKKEGVESILNLKNNKISLKIAASKQIEKDILAEDIKKSPKFKLANIENQLTKNKSLFSVSSFGVLNKKTDIKQIYPKQTLKMNYESKKLNLNRDEYNTSKKYNSETKKQEKNNVKIMTNSRQKLQTNKFVEKLKIRQISVGKLSTKDEFTDKNLATNIDFRMRSIKSQFTPATKKSHFHKKQKIDLKI